ncbi:MAG: outer membrane lipoprotein chaperone LolA [Pseudomonadales bacterium]
MEIEKYWRQRHLETKSAVISLVCLFLLSLHPPVVAESPLNAVDELQKHLNGLNDYRAEFQQVLSDEDGNVLQESNGVVQVQRPLMLHWQSLEPFKSVTVSDGETVWHHDIDLSQVSRASVNGDLSQAPALILGGDRVALEAQFLVTASSHEDGIEQFLLTPKVEEGPFESLTLRFSSLSVLSDMTIVDALSQITSITLSLPQAAALFDASLFDFVVPEGVDVIDAGG